MKTDTLIKGENNITNTDQVITNLFNEIESIIINEMAYQVNNTLVNVL